MRISGVRFVSPDGKFVLCNTQFGKWDLFDVTGGRRVSENIEEVNGPMPFSPDGKLVLFSTKVNPSVLFSLKTMRPLVSRDDPSDTLMALRHVHANGTTCEGKFGEGQVGRRLGDHSLQNRSERNAGTIAGFDRTCLWESVCVA